MTDSSTSWAAIDTAFDRALDLEGDERQRYLGSLDEGIRGQVEDLLEAATSDGPLSHDVGEVAGRLLEAADQSLDPKLAGRRIGSWRLLRRLGAGGMGVVYLAERADDAFDQRVALKVIRWELADSSLVQRFLGERQILAQLNHPNIGALFDGGMTDDGLPYLVLEHVDGVAVDRYCEREDLDREARIRLLTQVCRAVDFAHRRLVVHRDLKPSNILVRDDGVPKLLDFGVAKLLDDASVASHNQTTRFAPMTPRYAAPEQRRGEAVTVAADVWALGAMLGEVVTGTASTEPVGPERPASGTAISTGLPRREPDRDFRNIVQQAMHDEPERRYRTAGDLADDLDRYLDGRPVRATPPTLGYRLRKWAGRHRATAAAIVVACLAAVLGVAGVVWQAQVARQERDQARQEARRAEEVTDFLTTLFQSASPRLGEEPTARELLDEGAERIRTEVQNAPRVKVELMYALADSYKFLYEFEKAEALMREALAIVESEDTGPFQHSETISLLGGVLLESEQLERAEPLFRQALELLDEVDTRDSEEMQREVGESRVGNLNSLGMSLVGQGEPEEAVPLFRQAIELSQQLGYEKGVSMSRANLGNTLDDLGRHEEAEIEHRAAVEGYRLMQPNSSTRVTVLVNLAVNQGNLGRFEEAIDAANQARSLLELRSTGGARDLANLEANLAYLVLGAGRAEEAAELAGRALEAFEREAPNDTSVIGTRINLGWALALADRTEEALPALRQSVDELAERFGAESRITARGYLRYGAALLRAGRPDAASAPLEQAWEIVQADLELSATSTTWADIALPVARLRCDTGRIEEGLAAAETARRVYQGLHGDEHWLTAQAEVARARCLDALGEPWDREVVESARTILVDARSEDAWEVRRADELLSE